MARLHIRLNDETDQDILAWLDAQNDKTAAVKTALRAMMAGGAPQSEAAEMDLCAIRAVFETVLDERLGGLTVVGSDSGAGGPSEEDTELAAKLDDLF